MSRSDHELLAAYLDGVGELTPDERARVEKLLADDPAARSDADATRSLLGQLRALPPEGNEPDWQKLERDIRATVGAGVPRRWRWRWLVPVGALAVAAAALVLWLHHPAQEQTPVAQHTIDAGAPPAPIAATSEIYLGGEILDVGDVDEGMFLDDLDQDARDALATDEDDVTGGILPVESLDWVDQLDDQALDRAENWLKRKKG